MIENYSSFIKDFCFQSIKMKKFLRQSFNCEINEQITQDEIT